MAKDVYLTEQYTLSDESLLISGIKKLCQKFVIELLTEKGSMEYLPDRGTSFLTLLQSANTELGVTSAFSFATAQIKKNFKRENRDNMANSERLKHALLANIIIVDAAMQLYIQITNMNDEVYSVLTPPIALDG